LFDHRRKIRNTVQAAQIGKDRVEGSAFDFAQVSKRTLLHADSLIQPKLFNFFSRPRQHPGRNIGGMDTIAALRQRYCIDACASVELEDAAFHWQVAADVGINLIPQACQVRVVFGKSVIWRGTRRLHITGKNQSFLSAIFNTPGTYPLNFKISENSRRLADNLILAGGRSPVMGHSGTVNI
jgi:hypothetical protein